MNTPAATGTRLRGRPARTSREAILSYAETWLQHRPAAEISLSGLARAMGFTPMAMYRYFSDKEDLCRALAERQLQALQVSLGDSEDWRDKLRHWATSVRTYFLENPYSIEWISWQGHIADGWLKQIAVLVKVMADAGYQGRGLATAVKWFSTAVMGMVHTEILQRDSLIQLRAEDIQHRDPLVGELVKPLVDHFTEVEPEQLFTCQLNASLAWLEHQLTDDGKVTADH